MQLASLSVVLCALNEWTIFSTISVEPTENVAIVGMHILEIGSTSGPTNIFFTLDSLNNLELVLNEADKKVNMRDAKLKGRRKYKIGMFIRPSDMKDLIYKKISAQCESFM